MAWTSIVSDSDTGWAYPPNPPQPMVDNAMMIYGILNSYGWTLEAICGALGNMTAESKLNPGQYELGHGTPTEPYGYGYGVGLIQWTFPGNWSYPNPWLYWCQINNIAIGDGNAQLDLLNHAGESSYETMGLDRSIWGWIPTSSYPQTFPQFKQMTGSVNDTVRCFFYNMERPGPGDSSESNRLYYGAWWYSYLSGQDPPTPPGPGPGPSTDGSSMSIFFYLKQPYRRI